MIALRIALARSLRAETQRHALVGELPPNLVAELADAWAELWALTQDEPDA